MMRSDSKPVRCAWLAMMLGFSLRVASAETYYVDFEKGNDGGDGRTTATAWKHCPGDAAAAQVAQTSVLGPGDTVKFKGGVRYAGSIHLSFGGGENKPITYDGNLLADWGKGKAVIDGECLNDDTRRCGFLGNAGASHVVIRNFEITRLGGVPDLRSYVANGKTPAYSPGYGVYLCDAVDVEVRDCYFHEFGIWTNGPPASYDAGLGGFGIYAFGVDGLRIADCEFTRMEKGIRISPGQYGQNRTARRVLVTDCEFHNYMRWLVELSTSGSDTALDDITICHCQFHDFTEYDKDSWQGTGSNPHTDGIILGVSNYKNRNYGVIRLHSNCFYQNAANGGGTAMIFLTTMGGNVQIYNNVFINVRHSLGAIYAQDGPVQGSGDTPVNFEIYNNSFFDERSAVTLRTLTDGAELGRGNIRILNNVFYKTVADAAFSFMVYDASSAPQVLDYNCYYTLRADQLIMERVLQGGKAYATLDQARRLWGWETHGLCANPNYMDTTHGIGLNSSQNDLHLWDNSPCLRVGTNLYLVFTADKDRAPRPATGNWTVGAYGGK
jgi:hypothetical protein